MKLFLHKDCIHNSGILCIRSARIILLVELGILIMYNNLRYFNSELSIDSTCCELTPSIKETSPDAFLIFLNLIHVNLHIVVSSPR